MASDPRGTPSDLISASCNSFCLRRCRDPLEPAHSGPIVVTLHCLLAARVSTRGAGMAMQGPPGRPQYDAAPLTRLFAYQELLQTQVLRASSSPRRASLADERLGRVAMTEMSGSTL
ncbi:hypothetical protein F5144DRAFT_353848 [Chaetomium tenue]|uniref:Uncharacterized protein n=1 Tax=Chaetomium tenue TaxID=1854479 RepID=A0ACB7NXU6_9PEZI|nr:hypothetical protein F5144DRAFT_353848 [Chaetomium globosum]